MKFAWLPLLVLVVACSPPQFSGTVINKYQTGNTFTLKLEKCDVELSKKCERADVAVDKKTYERLDVGDLYIR